MIKEIKVVPNSSKQEVGEGNPIIVRVKEKAEKGKANQAVLKLLRKHYGCDVSIVSGHKSSRKKIKIG